MIRIEIHAFSGLEIAEKIVQYCEKYHPAGYGTEVKRIISEQSGQWVAIIERARSCD